MTPERWKRVRDLFELAFDLPPGADVDQWIARHADDPEVAGEVRSLLAQHDRAGTFLSQPVSESVPGLLDDSPGHAPGDTVGFYRIKRELGRGGMGRVYLATDTRLGRDVALKVLSPRLVQDPSQRERLRREARAAAALSHSGICTVYALDEIGDDVVVATEHVAGRTLREEIAAGRRPSDAGVRQALRELSAALAAAHARGITHRDLKPENVMRAPDGSLKVLDFGLALVDGGLAGVDAPRVTTPGTVLGTPGYMAPEQITGQRADARTDIFALGVLVFELATGVHPFDARTPVGIWARVLEGEPTPLLSLRADLSPLVARIVERCLRRDPADRYANADQVLAALTGDAAEAAPPRQGPFWWRMHLVSVIALYTAAALAGWFVKEWHQGPTLVGFVLLAMLATTGGVLRGHLLFAERAHTTAAFHRELRRARSPLTAIDLAVAATLVGEGLWVALGRPVSGVLIIGLGLGLALGRFVLEPSTTQAAFAGDAPQ